MINSHISFLFRELNEIIKTLESRSNYDKNGYEIVLIKNLKLIKNKLDNERWMNLDESMRKIVHDTYQIFKTLFDGEMIKENDCYLATKMSRTFLKLVGKHFQGITNLMIAQISISYDINFI